jgi:hypothetical protein
VVPREYQQLKQTTQQQANLIRSRREEALRLAEIYWSSNTAEGRQQAERLYMEVDQMDASLLQMQQTVQGQEMYLHGMQALYELSINDPRRAELVMRYNTGANVQLTPREDGTYKYSVNGTMLEESMDSSSLAEMLLMMIDPQARQARSQSAQLTNELALRRLFDPAIAVALINERKETVTKLIEDAAKEQDRDLKIDFGPDGEAYITENKRVIYTYNPRDAKEVETPFGRMTDRPSPVSIFPATQ